jgi:hypothetical protein
MSFRDTIAELEINLDEAKRSYLRGHGWSMTFDTPGAASMWERDFDRRVVLADLDRAVQMTMTALDPVDRPEEDSAE